MCTRGASQPTCHRIACRWCRRNCWIHPQCRSPARPNRRWSASDYRTSRGGSAADNRNRTGDTSEAQRRSFRWLTRTASPDAAARSRATSPSRGCASASALSSGAPRPAPSGRGTTRSSSAARSRSRTSPSTCLPSPRPRRFRPAAGAAGSAGRGGRSPRRDRGRPPAAPPCHEAAPRAASRRAGPPPRSWASPHRRSSPRRRSTCSRRLGRGPPSRERCWPDLPKLVGRYEPGSASPKCGWNTTCAPPRAAQRTVSG